MTEKRRANGEGSKRPKKEKEPKPVRIIGVDGEGYDAPCGVCLPCMAADTKPLLGECKKPRHLYVYIAAVDDQGVLVAEAYDPEGLSHADCANMLLSLPEDALKFGFMFSYDVTKIIEELPPIDRFYLVRPQLRDETKCLNSSCGRTFKAKSEVCIHCGATELRRYSRKVRFRGKQYDFFNGSLSIQHKPTRRKVKIWDCFRFFGCAFVEALKDWKVGTIEQVERIAGMKQKRGALEHEDPEEVKAYCREECHLLAVMMGKVKTAHEQAGIPLKRYEGAGSTASALLTANDVARFKGPRHKDLDPRLGHAIASCFFGGRFEDSMVGIVREPVFGFDISSAYPFALSGLPCLTCGKWRLVRNATYGLLKNAPLALASFYVREIPSEERRKLAWGPLPFRDDKGSICYGTNFRGWAWAPELLAAIEGWPDLVVLTGEAWIYEIACVHKPFAFMPDGYRQRVAWGKEGAGKALKLGMNAAYGKCAQSLGEDPPFQSWVFAGMATGITRGLLLNAIASAEDRWNVLTLATDGVYSLEDLRIGPPSRDTGTGDLPKPLGGWERKAIPEGVFVAKPGLYYKLGADLPDVRARGIGRREVHSAAKKIEEGFLKWDRQDPKHAVRLTSRRFYGAKNSIYVRSRCERCRIGWPSVPETGCPKCHQIGIFDDAFTNKDAEDREVYGLWGEREIRIAFDPFPKREREGISRAGTYARLTVRDLGGQTSAPYDVGAHATTPEGEALRAAQELQLEQPDWTEELA